MSFTLNHGIVCIRIWLVRFCFSYVKKTEFRKLSFFLRLVVGATVGYIMFQIKDKKFPDSQFVTISYWTVTLPVLVGTLFITYFKDSTNFPFALALSFGRYFMGLFIGSIVVMCHLGYGGVINSIFSSRFFVHANKTTYIMYLIHPVLIMFFNSTQESSSHFDVPSLVSEISVKFSPSYNTKIKKKKIHKF